MFQVLSEDFCFVILFTYCPKGLLFSWGGKIVTVFPGESKKRKSTNDDKHGHGQEKREPLELWRGGKRVCINRTEQYMYLRYTASTNEKHGRKHYKYIYIYIYRHR